MTEVVDVYGALRDPFPENDIGWRIGRSGAKDGDPWAMCLAYITNRAIQTRLDTIVGPENWYNRFRRGPQGGVLCEAESLSPPYTVRGAKANLSPPHSSW